jgi:asparagine synthase (glutamine-hydrolysing)
LYEAYGIESFSMLDGMFAFSIHDKKTNKVLIETLEKNLYTTVKTVIVLSGLEEIDYKILPSKPAINKTALNLFLKLTYIPLHSIYKDIHKLEANHYLEFDCNDFNFQIHEINQRI